MHIVHFIARLNDGGPARVLAALGRELSARGHRLTVLAGSCAADEIDASGLVRASGVEVEMVPGLGRRPSLIGDARAFAWLCARLRALRPDLLHTHTAKAGALGRLAARWLRLPCLHTYHGHVLDGYFPPAVNLALRWSERLLAGESHHQALTPSQLRALAFRYAIGRRRRWHCLPVPVEPVRACAASWHAELIKGRAVVGFLGRLTAVKDPDLWLDALAALNRRVPVQGVICGEGGERARLMARAATLDVPVRFTGQIPAGEALAVMDVLLMTSRNEGLPLSVIEAAGLTADGQARGVPVAAPAVGGLRDLIAGGVVEGAEREADALALAAQRLLDDAGLRRRRLRCAAALAQRLAPAMLAPRYEALYRAIVVGGSPW